MRVSAADRSPTPGRIRWTKTQNIISHQSPGGLTLGPVSGRLLADMITGATPLVDPTPFRAERFLS